MRRARADRRAVGAAAEDAVAEADLADPNPDVEELFRHYDALYFHGALAAADFAVRWSSSLLSSSFGSCTFSKPSNTITLSEPVLKYRSCTDLKKALLHEMIHAILYVKHHKKDCCQHGPLFRDWMDAINSCSIKDPQRPVSGYNITTRHDFKSERPFSFKGILWKCESCGDTLPRATNLGPPSDACCLENVDHDATCGNMLCHWHNHKNECGGSYESMGFQSVTPVQKKVPKGNQLLLTYSSETSKSKGAIQESKLAELQENTKVTKQNAEDEHLSLSSLTKADKRPRSEVVQKAIVLAVEPPKEVKREQTLIAVEKHGHFSPVGCNDARSLGVSTSKKQHKPEDVQKPNAPPAAHLGKPKLNQQLVLTERHKLFSLEGCDNVKSLGSSSLQKTGKRRRSEVVDKASILPDEPPKEMNQNQALIAIEEHELFSPGGCNDATSPGNGPSKKASKQHKPEDIQKPSILPAVPQGTPKLKQNFAPTETHNLSSLEDCNDAKTPGCTNAKKARKQHKPESAPATSQGKPKLTQECVTTDMHKLLSLEACNYAKSSGSNTSKQADEHHKPTSAQKACSQHAYPLRRLKKDSVALEKNELFHLMGCSHEKLLDKSSSKKTQKRHEPKDIQEKTMLPTVPRHKPKESSFVASQQQQRKCRRQPVPLDNSRIDVSVSSHKFGTGSRKDESVQQPWPPSPCYKSVVSITVEQVLAQATGGHSQTSAPCLDIIPLQQADASPDSVPPNPAIIDISDDD